MTCIQYFLQKTIGLVHGCLIYIAFINLFIFKIHIIFATLIRNKGYQSLVLEWLLPFLLLFEAVDSSEKHCFVV